MFSFSVLWLGLWSNDLVAVDIGCLLVRQSNGTRWPTSVLVCLVCDTGEGAAEQPGLQILVSAGFPLSGLEGFLKNSMGDGPDRDNARDARRGHTHGI